MIETAITVLEKAAELGLRLKAVDSHLHVNPGRCCPTEFADTLRVCKTDLLALLRLPFVMVYSKTLGDTVFFCENENTRAVLVEAGASEGSIYTKDELRILVAQNRISPLTNQELRKMHQIKRTFGAKIKTQRPLKGGKRGQSQGYWLCAIRAAALREKPRARKRCIASSCCFSQLWSSFVSRSTSLRLSMRSCCGSLKLGGSIAKSPAVTVEQKRSAQPASNHVLRMLGDRQPNIVGVRFRVAVGTNASRGGCCLFCAALQQ